MLRYALAARRLRRFPSRASPPPAAAPLEERLEGWEERVRAFHRFFTVEAEGEETLDTPPDVQAAGEALMSELVDGYASADAGQRARLRALVAANPYFAWAIGLPGSVDSVEALRRRLIQYALVDRRPDWRDETVALGEMLAKARRAGVDAAPVLREVAAIAGEDDDPHRSTRAALLDAARPPPRRR